MAMKEILERMRETDLKDLEIIREKERFRKTGLSRVQWWRLEKEGQVPKRIALGKNSCGWIRSEIQEWITKRAAERGR